MVGSGPEQSDGFRKQLPVAAAVAYGLQNLMPILKRCAVLFLSHLAQMVRLRCQAAGVRLQDISHDWG